MRLLLALTANNLLTHHISRTCHLSMIVEPALEFAASNPLALAAVVIVLVAAYIHLRIKGEPVPPGTPSIPVSSIPLAGCLPFFVDNWDHLPDLLTKYDALYGKTWFAPVPKVGMLGGGVYSISREDNVRHILKDNFDNYEKGKNFRDALGDFLGEGIFASDGKAWKHHRKVATNMFSRKLMRNGTVVAVKQLRRSAQVLSASSERTSLTPVINIHHAPLPSLFTHVYGCMAHSV